MSVEHYLNHCQSESEVDRSSADGKLYGVFAPSWRQLRNGTTVEEKKYRIRLVRRRSRTEDTQKQEELAVAPSYTVERSENIVQSPTTLVVSQLWGG